MRCEDFGRRAGVTADAGDVPKAAAVGALRGTAQLAKGSARYMADDQDEFPNPADIVGGLVGEGLSALAGDTEESISPRSRAAQARTSLEGDISKPSTWGISKGASLRGAAMHTAESIGGVAPIVGGAMVAGPMGAAAAGAAQMSEGGRESAE